MSGINLKNLRDFLLANLGLYFTENQEKDMYRKISDAALGFDYQDVDLFISWLITQKLTSVQVEKLATYLTIGETYFLRERTAFDYLEYEYLPKLIAQRRECNNKFLKIWNAGCSSGEEPYTVAIMLRRLIPDIEDWTITIMATDINPTFIKKAKDGIYSKWSFRRIPDSFVEENFEAVSNKRFALKPEIKKMVKFSFLNLIDDTFPSQASNTTGVDVIFCRNVMIYFSNEGVRTVCSKFYNSLASSGVFMVSPVEASSISHTEFGMVSYQGYTIFNKEKKTNQQSDDWYALLEKKASEKSRLSSGRVKHIKELEKSKADLAMKLSRVNRLMTATKKPDQNISIYAEALSLYKSDALCDAEKFTEQAILETEGCKDFLYLLLARIKANKGDLHTAEELCLKALSGDKINVNAYYFLSIVLNEQGRIQEAIRSAENALFLDPSFVLGHYMLGSIKMNSLPGWEKHFVNAKRILSKEKEVKVLDEADGVTVGSLLDIINSSGV